MRLLVVWIWESLENLPMILGFVAAVRLWQENITAGIRVLVVGIGLGILTTRLVEPRLHREKHEVRLVSTLVNFGLFLAFAIPFLYYFRAETRWINWKMDLAAGLVVGGLLSYGQSLHWRGAKSRMVLHGAAMMASVPVIMVGLRGIVRVESWGLAMFFTILLTLFASLIIALIDYQEMYRRVD